jgi:hypothetical protein
VTHQRESFCRKLEQTALGEIPNPSVVIADVSKNKEQRAPFSVERTKTVSTASLYGAPAACATGTLKRSSRSGQLFPPWLATYIASSKRLQTPSVSNVPNQRGDLDFPGGQVLSKHQDLACSGVNTAWRV